IVRYLPNGSLDTTFDGEGVTTAPINVYATASGIAIRPDGKLVVAGTRDDGSNVDFALVRFNPNGSLDTTFGGGDGETAADFDNSEDYARGMVLDSVGRAIVVGYSDRRFAIAR